MIALASTVFNGSLVCARSRFWSALRNLTARSLALIPPIRYKLEMGLRGVMMRYKFVSARKYTNGRYLPSSCFLEDREGGVFIPQIHIWHENSHMFSDDVIFAKRKKSLFQLVVLADSISEAQCLQKELTSSDFDTLSGDLISKDDVTYIIHETKKDVDVPNNFVFAMSVQEYDDIGGWPPLKGYDKNRIKIEFPWKKFLVVRSDRYTFGTAQTMDGLEDIARRANELLLG